GSYNGIKINGERIQGQTPVNDDDLIQIGDYDLAIQTEASPSMAPTIQMSPAPPALGNGAAGHISSPRIPVHQPAHPPAHAAAPAHAAVHPQDLPTETATPVMPAEAQPAPEGDGPRRTQSTAVIRIDQVDGNPRRQVAAIDATEAPRLCVLNTELAGREFALVRTEIRVGRTEDNDVAVDHRSLSRLHAKVVREDSGEWRILDMESANGVSVNGERYAQVSLRSGDVIELGHVKMKFLAPGEAFRFTPGGGGGGRQKLVLGAGGLVLLAALGAGAYALFGGGGGGDPKPGHTPTGTGGNTGTGTGTTTSPPNPPPNPANRPPAPATDVEALLAAAQKAMDKQEFDKVEELLQPLANPDGTRPEKVEDLLRQASEEKENKRKLKEAQKELNGGNCEAAERLLAESQGTLSFATEWQSTRAKFDKGCRKKPVSPSKAAEQARLEEALKDLEEGKLLLKKKQYKEAQTFFTRCLELDRNSAECHLALGSTYARLRDPEKGAQHYREFLRLAPDHERSPEVRRLLQDYEDQRPKQK
ncbi:MAG TPA: FHA domain-containing protein, partial [Myxococcaceae bacterium]